MFLKSFEKELNVLKKCIENELPFIRRPQRMIWSRSRQSLMLDFIIDGSWMKHPDLGTVAKLRLNKCFHHNTAFF